MVLYMPKISFGSENLKQHCFWQSLIEKFVSFNPKNPDSFSRCGERLGIKESRECAWSNATPKTKFSIISKDIQDFFKAPRKVFLSQLAGNISETAKNSMSLEIQNNRTEKMKYKYKGDYPREHWVHYDAFIVWQRGDKLQVTHGIQTVRCFYNATNKCDEPTSPSPDTLLYGPY